ncbi:MAG: hypothetical protein EOO27_30205, partial [Comamonadaceae bacterium]
MATPTARAGLQLRSLVHQRGELELSLVSLTTPDPAPEEVIVRIEATPINPSDLALLLAGANVGTARMSGTADHPILTASIPDQAMTSMTARVNESMPVGNEGAGVVVEAGSSDAAQALLGKTVAVFGGAMYTQYRCVKAQDCLVLPEGTTAAQGASCFVNPLTALGMVETMRREGHGALVHTAAASSLGRMLNRLCIRDNIGLVNVVRKAEQADILRAEGAVHVCNSSSSTFLQDLTQALAATGATIAFDATGGGELVGQILSCMEAALNLEARGYSVYGSTTHKQAYLYGRLDTSPTKFTRNFGQAWGMGGWLLFPFLQKIGLAATQQLKERVAREVKTTFANQYTKEISLVQALQPQVMAAYAKRATGEKYLINPNMDKVRGNMIANPGTTAPHSSARPYLHPSAWKGEDLRTQDDWIIHLDADDIAELESALAFVKSRAIGIPGLSRNDFVMPGLARKMGVVLHQLEAGRGFVLLRGLPVGRYSKADAATIYWGIGAHLGQAFAQNAQGDMLGHVRDLGANLKAEMRARGYHSRLHLPFHNDSTDVVGLLCLQKAKSGGASRLVSSAAIHNEFVTRRPDLWATMCAPFCVDRRGEENPGQKPYYVTPCFNHLDGRLFVRYNRTYIESA